MRHNTRALLILAWIAAGVQPIVAQSPKSAFNESGARQSTAAPEAVTRGPDMAPDGGSANIGTLMTQGLGAGQTLASLRSNAMGSVRGCDYMRYLQAADQASTTVGSFRDLMDNARDAHSAGIPMTDYVSALFKNGGNTASKKSAKAEQESLVLMLEQVCNTSQQSDETRRILEIVQATRHGIGATISALFDNGGFLITHLPGDITKIKADWARLYGNSLPEPGTTIQDSMYTMLNDNLESTLAAGAEMDSALDKVQLAINGLKHDLILYPTADSAGHLSCPKGYDVDLRSIDAPRDDRGVVMCGPATPERSTQILAQTAVLQAQLKAIELKAMSASLQTDAIHLAADNHARRIQSTLAHAVEYQGH